MAGASANHKRISGNILAEFNHHLKASPCEPFGSDMKLKAGSSFFLP
jgi:Uma2 family endonuclease